jgi:hypothetical protein
MQLEVIALTRDIPATLRWFIDPIVRRIAKGSLFTSLEKTRQAVHAAVEAGRHAPRSSPARRSKTGSQAPEPNQAELARCN